MSVLIVIPARLKATRLPNKPLAMIGDAPMIVQVWRRAMEAGVGEVIVACDGEEIKDAITRAGGQAVITHPDHPSGSDRIWEAVQGLGFGIRDSGRDEVSLRAQRRNPENNASGSEHWIATSASPPRNDDSIIINLQGDVPTLEPRLLKDLLKPLENPAVDIATLVAEIRDPAEHTNPSVVKAVIGQSTGKSAQVLYFSRACVPANDGPRYHHIGVYAYRYAALEKFVALPPSPLELREKLEQLRALEAGMRIDAVVVDTVPLGVDTAEDLEKARAILG